MTMQVLMLRNRMVDGVLLASGSTQTVSDEDGAYLVANEWATRTDGVPDRVITGNVSVPTIDQDTGAIIDSETGSVIYRATRTLSRSLSNPSNTQQTVLLPKTAIRARISYTQGTGSAAVGEAMYITVGASGTLLAATILADQALRDVILLGQTMTLDLPGDQALRVDFKTKTAETGSSVLTIEIDGYAPDVTGTHIVTAPCRQTRADTIVRDISGRNINLMFGANLTEAIAWATPGQLTLPATANNSSVAIPNANMDAEFMMSRGDILLLHLDHAVTITSGTQGWVGNSSAFSATNPGFRLRGAAADYVCSLGLHSTLEDKYLTLGAVCDGTRHTTTLVLNTRDKTAMVAHDGFIFAAEWDWSAVTGTLDNTGTNAFRFGSANTSATQASVFRGIHVARLDAMPNDLDALASWLTFAPHALLELA